MYIVKGNLEGKHYGHIFIDGKTFVYREVWKLIFERLGFKVIKISDKNPEDIKKILIIHDNKGYGDNLFITPAIRGLKEKFTNVSIEVYGNYPAAMILAYNPYIDKLNWSFPARHILALVDEYDEVYDTSDFIRQKVTAEFINIYDLYCHYLEVKPLSMSPVVEVSKKETKEIINFLGVAGVDSSKEKLAILQLHASNMIRTWPAQNSIDLAKSLVKKGYRVLLVGSSEMYFNDYLREDFGKDSGIINLIGALDIRAFIALISISQLVIGPDSLAYHIAEAFKVPNIPICSAFDPYLRAKYYKYCYPVYKPYKCGPCGNNALHCPTRLDKPKILDVSYCMSLITVKDVLKKVEDIRNKKKIKLEAPKRIINKDCPICNSKQKNLICRKGDVYYWRCFNCGLIYVDRFTKNTYAGSILEKCKDPFKVLKNSKKKVFETPNAKLITKSENRFLNGQYCGEYTHLFTPKAIKILYDKLGVVYNIKEESEFLKVEIGVK